jgi:NAD(P)-dependent dehydrogenase (short-subunit alcohol dehydrogenase family)
MNLLDLSGKKALIVGAGGIGTALAIGFAQHGSDVAVADRNAGSADAAASAVRAFGCRTLARTVDVTHEASVNALAADLAASWGGVDILVNTAGVAARLPSVSVPVDKMRETLEVNTIGTFLCCRVFGREMMGRGGGKIVNVSSVRARYGTRGGMADYCASKGAVDALTRQLAVEWAPNRIYVNAIAPTVVETEFTAPILSNPKAAADLRERIPLGRWAQPADLIGPALFFASAASDYVTGQILFVDGGLTAVV